MKREVIFLPGNMELDIEDTSCPSKMSELEVMFGTIRCHTYCLALNHLIIWGKYFLYVNAINSITYQFHDFVSLVRDKINLEKYISVTCNREKEFKNKWNFFYLCKICMLFFLFLAFVL